MNASHIATGTITALIATALVYLTHWPLQPLDLQTASAFAGLLVAAAVPLSSSTIQDDGCRRADRPRGVARAVEC